MVPTMLHLERFAVMGVVAPISMGSESTEQLGAIWSGFEARRSSRSSRKPRNHSPVLIHIPVLSAERRANETG